MKVLLIILLLSSIIKISAQEATEMQLISHWSDAEIDSQDVYIHYNEVWGMVVNEHEYAVIGSYLGTHVIDITDPEIPYEAFFIKGKYSEKNVIHRDYHDYNGYLYAVCDEGSSSLQIMDLHYLPDSLPVVYDSSALLVRSHNIFIDSTSNRLYHAGGSSQGAITVFDISNPIDPIELGFYNEFNNNFINYAHDVFVRNDTAYLNCGGSGLVILDLKDTDSPQTIAVLGTDDYPHSGYNHSGWITEDGKTYVMADETKGRDVKLFDIKNLPDIELHTTINPGNGDNSLAHNPIIKGKYLYTAYYDNGLQVWDIEDPSKPIKTNYYIPHFEPNTWGVYPFLPSGNIIISDYNSGLYILKGIDTTSIVNKINSVKHTVDINIFPNPVNNYLSIDLADLKTNVKYQILNINGLVVQHGIEEPINSEVSIYLNEGLLHGIYIIELSTDDIVYKAKFVK